MSKSEWIQVRIEPRLKAEAELVAEKNGVTLSEAIRKFLAQYAKND